jgi:hypothetical protein
LTASNQNEWESGGFNEVQPFRNLREDFRLHDAEIGMCFIRHRKYPIANREVLDARSWNFNRSGDINASNVWKCDRSVGSNTSIAPLEVERIYACGGNFDENFARRRNWFGNVSHL